MIRFGVAGFGLHAVKRLMPGFAEAKRCEVTALTRRDPQKAQQSAREFGIRHAFTTTAQLCSSPDVDAVFIATPDAMHRDDVLTAVRLGKPVLVEKPMAMNAAEARAMVEFARANHVMLGVAHVMRFEESVRLLRNRIADGAIGRPVLARADFSAPLISSPRVWINDPSLATGGPIADVGVHCIDTLRYILDDEVTSVSARAQYDSRWTVEASGALLLEFEAGTLATVSVSGRSPYQTMLEVAGEDGVLSALNAMTVDQPIMVEMRRGFEVVERTECNNWMAYAAQVDAFAAAVEEKREFDIPGDEGLRNQLILDAAFRSAKSGQIEKLR